MESTPTDTDKCPLGHDLTPWFSMWGKTYIWVCEECKEYYV